MNKTDALIIGAGPTGLFTAHQLKLIGLDCEIVDNLDKIGGQCIELYPDKPIYDIPAIPECTGEELTNNLINQLKPFDIKFHLNERVDEVKKEKNNWKVKTNNGKVFSTPNVIIAGGVGSFEPRKFAPKECEKFENKSLFYSVKDKNIFNIKGSSYSGKASINNIVGNWWNHKILQTDSQISPISGSIKEQVVTFVAKEKIILYGKTYEVDHFKLRSKDMNLPKDKRLDFNIWYDQKSSMILKVTYSRMGSWEYRLKNFE